MGLSNKFSCEAGSFSHCCNPHRFFQSGFEALFPPRWHPGLHGLSHSSVVPPGLSTCKYGTTCSTSHHLASSLLHPDCLSLPQLPASAPPTSLDECFFFTPWLLDFHTVQFSGISGCFWFLNLLSFWLCEEAQCIYLRLHLDQKFVYESVFFFIDCRWIV